MVTSLGEINKRLTIIKTMNIKQIFTNLYSEHRIKEINMQVIFCQLKHAAFIFYENIV